LEKGGASTLADIISATEPDMSVWEGKAPLESFEKLLNYWRELMQVENI